MARKAKKLSQAQLSRVIDVSYQQLQKYETGANRIGSGRLLKIARALDTPITYFFEGLDAPHITPQGVTWWMLEWASQLDKIKNKKLRDHILGLIEASAKESVQA